MPKKCSSQGCTTRPPCDVVGTKIPELCAQYAKQGMVDVSHAKCADQGCIKAPSYGKKRSKRPEFCVQHAKLGMVSIIKICADQGCTKGPSYGIVGSKRAEFCAQHAKKGMVDVNHRKCANQNCTKGPSYGIEGSKKREFCAQHAKQGMVDVRNRKCANQCCTKAPSYGIEGSKKAHFCAQHAKQGMVDVSHRKCANQNCTKMPSFGIEGSKSREFCAQHAKQGMVGIIGNKKCANQSCTTVPSYGIIGSRPEFCAQHATQGMLNVLVKRCTKEGCSKRSSHGTTGSKMTEFCARHAEEGMIRFQSSKRVGRVDCSKPPSRRVDDGINKSERRTQRALQDVVGIPSKEGTRQDCCKSLSFGVDGSDKVELCVQCAEAGMARLGEKSPAASCVGVECRRNPTANGTVNRVGAAGCKREDSEKPSVMETNYPGNTNKRTSRKRARGNHNLMVADSVQAASTRTRRVGPNFSAGLGLAAAPDVITPILEVNGLAVKNADSGVEEVPSGGAIEPLFSPASGVTVKVE